SAGSGPTLGRNCSSLSLNLHSTSWLVDCAEGTQIQLQRASNVTPGRISKVFITHLHVDHCFGILPFMNTAMSSASNPGKPSRLDNVVRLEFYGPSGLRQMIRTNLKLTQMSLLGKYAAHELLFDNEPTFTNEETELHSNEVPGQDIRIGPDGLWHNIEDSEGFTIDAGPIVHRVTSLGYVFNEKPTFHIGLAYLRMLDDLNPLILPRGVSRARALLSTLADNENPQPVTLQDGSIIYPPPRELAGRKLVILGDTSDPSAMIPISQDADVLVHESTNAWIPASLSKNQSTLMTPEEVQAKAISRGHATPGMAGQFAATIRAKALYLNHFGVK
ncbi:hypothetical protein M422DRAFT_183727, partial [Sphaerobolus stellatus SS14]